MGRLGDADRKWPLAAARHKRKAGTKRAIGIQKSYKK
jgi:hypothetical protein